MKKLLDAICEELADFAPFIAIGLAMIAFSLMFKLFHWIEKL